MAKRLFAWVLVIALVLSMMPAVMAAAPGESALNGHTSHEGWTEWKDKNSLPTTAGQYYLSVDVDLNGGWYPDAEIHLCLCGHDITQTKDGYRVLDVLDGGNVSIYDCTGNTDENGIYTAGRLTGGTKTIGAGVNVQRGGVFNLYGGKITGNSKSGTDGGGVYLQAAKSSGKTAGMFNMYGGQICGNSSKRGAGVFVAGGLDGEDYTNAVFNMYGGIIGGYGEGEANVATAEGGAICAITYGAVNIQGGKIIGNKAKTGAGIWASDNIVLNVENAEFTGNQSTNASAIYIQNRVQLTIKDTTVTGNTGTSTSADGWGAAVVATGSTSKVTLKGKVYIKGNTMANAAIGDLYLNSAEGCDMEQLYVDGMTGGFVVMGVHDSAASVAAASDVISGTTENFRTGSVAYRVDADTLKRIGVVGGTFSFVEGHFHEGVEYQAWGDDEEEKGKLPASGTYYLVDKLDVSDDITVTDALCLCLNGKTLTQTTDNRFFTVNRDKVLTIEDCGTTGTITGGKNNFGSVVYLSDGAIFNLYGGKLIGNGPIDTAKEQTGAPVFLKNSNKAGATFNMYGGEITGNGGAKNWGGAASNGGGSDTNTVYVNIYGGKIYNNTAVNGGAIRLEKKSVLKIYGGEIYGNHANNGGAIYLNGVAEMVLAGGNIHDNTATKYGGGIYKAATATVTVSGNPIVANNKVDTALNNLYVAGDATFTVGKLTEGASIGLSRKAARASDVMSSNAVTESALAYFTVDNSATYEKALVDGKLALVEAGSVTPPVTETHVHKLCNDTSCTSHGADVTFEKWTDATTLPTSGNYYLDVDVNLTAAVENTGTLNLCLNGHTIKQTTAEKRVLGVKIGTTISITDCGTTGTITGGGATYGSTISVRYDSTFNLYGGKITGNNSTSEGTVYLQGGTVNTEKNYPIAGTFNMYGGEISGNTTKFGGAVSVGAPVGAVTQNPAVNIYGGKLTGNTTTGRGGAINASGAATIYIENAEISGNTAGGNGTIYTHAACTVTIKNTKIKNNNASSNAAISLEGGTLTLDGAVIENNHASGGYSAVTGVSTVILKGATVIDGNTNGTDKTPGNLYLNSDVMVDVSGLTDTAKIGLYRSSGREQDRVSTAALASSSELTRFESDLDIYEVDQDAEGYLVLAVAGSHDHKLCNNAACADHKDVAFRKWTATDSLPTEGSYYLENDVNLTAVSYAEGNLVLCLNGHTITQTKAARVLQTKSGGSLTITDCGTTGTITGGRNDTGASIFVTDSTTFNLYAGKITGSAPATSGSATSGAAIFLRSGNGTGATFNMYGGEITGNGNEKSWAGAIGNGSGNANNYVYVNIYGGKIYGNTAGTGGAIRMEQKSITTIYGGEIYGNSATGNGGAIYLSSGSPELIIKGGKIYGNSADTAGGIYVHADAKVTVSGAPVVYDNTVDGRQNNLYLAGKSIITLGDVATDAKIGVTATTIGRAISTETDTDYTNAFVGDKAKQPVTYQEKTLWIDKRVETSDHQHSVCDGVQHGTCEHDNDQMWIKWGDDEDEVGKLPTTSGYYYLTQDIQLTSYQLMETNQDIYLCLNGKTVTAPKENRHFATNTGTTMAVTDCSANPGGFTGGRRTYGGSVNVVAGSTFNLYAGKFYGNTAPDNEGGAIYLQGSKTNSSGTHIAGGIFNMYGGEIYGNTAKYGAGVRGAGIGDTGEKDPSVFNMYGGKIYDNQAVCQVSVDADGVETKIGGQGGGVAITNSTVMNLYGGQIYSNTAEVDGGGIYMLADSDLYIKGGKIEDNSSGSTGGGIFANGKGSTITMEAGLIDGNTTKSGGGVITQTRAVFTMNGGKITGNNATSGGGGIYVSTNTDFIMNGGEISGNHTKGTGAGFYALRSRVTLNGGEINGNKSDYRGGAFRSAGGTIEINAVTIKGNEAPEGGAAYINRTSTGSGEDIKYYPSTVNINDGALITSNKGTSNSGGILMANDGVVVTMNGGEISKNTSANGAGLMTWRGSLFVMKGGKITGNVAKNCGGGVYVSTASNFRMEGGSISSNTAKSGGALYVYRSEAEFAGGTISGNRAKHTSTWKDGKEVKSGGTAGAMYISGAKVNLKGTSFISNYSSVNGGAIMMGRASYTEGGVKKIDTVTVNFSAGLFSNNKTEGAGGAMLIQSEGTVVNMYGGTVTNNTAKNAGGIYVSTKTKFNMTGGTIARNKATASAGAIYVLKSTATITGGQIYSNSATASGGMFVVSGDTAVLNLKNMKLRDGEAKTAAVMVVQSKAHAFVENCDFYDNTSTNTAGAVYVSTRSFGEFTDCKFYSNTAGKDAGALYLGNFAEVTVTGCDFTENAAMDSRGGAIFTCPGTEIKVSDTNINKCTATGNGGAIICYATAYLTNVTIENCSAENGGAVATNPNNAGGVGVRDGVVAKNCQFRNNTAKAQGGAFYIWKGRPLHLYDSKVTGNTAGTEGGAIWAYEDVELHNAQITDNTSGGEGFAVYMNDANYDGHSYYTSKNKLSGNVIIKDNNGGDLYMGPDVAFAITADGLGENTHIEVTLDSGVVTQRILGAYHYEGGEQVYTITYGDRSMTDPEIDPSLVQSADDEAAKTEKAVSGDTWLYVGIGLFVAAIIAVVAIVIAKKKKAGNTAEKATKE